MNLRSHHLSPRLLILSTLCAAALVAGCGGKKEGAAATQVAAKVNKSEISVHQINFLLQRQANLKPEQMPVASKRTLEGLIDQELAAQAAEEQKLDRDPRIVMALEQAKREIIARAYLEKLGGAAVKPNEDEITRFYSDKPALFSARKIYTLREVSLEAPAAQAKELAQKAKSVKSDDLVASLKAANIRYGARQIVQPPENLPLDLVDRLAGTPDGGTLVNTTPKGLNIVYVVSSKPAPVTEDQAKPAIEAFLLNDRKRKLVLQGMKALRDSAKITYQGQFAAGATSADTAASEAVAPTFDATASGNLDDRALQKGLKGLK